MQRLLNATIGEKKAINNIGKDMLKENERLDFLECRDLNIIQDKRGYTFTTDAVLLANFVKAYSSDKILDIGTGSGVIPLLCSAKTTAKEIVGLEIQLRLAEMSSRSVELNKLSPRVKIVNGDIKNALSLFGSEYFDVITSNPPYMTFDGKVEDACEQDVCKREVLITIDELMQNAAKVLKYGGKAYFVYKADRLTDLLCAMRDADIEPKVITFVQPKPSKPIDTVLVEGKKGAKHGAVVAKPLVICDENGEYTPEAQKIYKPFECEVKK